MVRIQKQTWDVFTRYLIVTGGGSVQMKLFKEPSDDYGCTAFIYALWVDSDQRRKGRAKTLLDLAEKIAAQEGHKEVFLDWSEKDTPVEILHWYLRRGYEEVAFSGRADYYLLKKSLKTKA